MTLKWLAVFISVMTTEGLVRGSPCKQGNNWKDDIRNSLDPSLQASSFLCEEDSNEPYPQFNSPSLLGPSISGNSFTFTCDFSHTYTDPSVMFDIIWKFNNNTFMTDTVQAPGHSSSLDDTSWNGHLGQELSCSVRSYFDNDTQRHYSSEKTSTYYHGGITIQASNHTLTEGKDTQITVKSTLPILCSSDTGSCSLHLRMILENNNTLPGTDLLFGSCGVVTLDSRDYQSTTNTVSAVTTVTMPMNQILLPDGQQVVRFEVVGNNQAADMWDGHVGTNLDFKTHDIGHGQCSMFGNGGLDIFNKTFDESIMEREPNSGDYIMYRGDPQDPSDLEVQVRLMVEKSTAASVCAVAVQYGGDVLTIDMCSENRTRGAPFVTSTRPDGTAMTVHICDPAYYVIYTDDDVAVEVRVHEQNMDVNLHLPPSYSQESLGLCSFLLHTYMAWSKSSYLRLVASESFFAEGKDRFRKTPYSSRPNYCRCATEACSTRRRITDSIVYKLGQCRSIKPKSDQLYHDWNIHLKGENIFHHRPLHIPTNTVIDFTASSVKCTELEEANLPYMCLHSTPKDFIHEFHVICHQDSITENGYNLVSSTFQGLIWGCQHLFLQDKAMYLPDASTGLLKPTPTLSDELCQDFCSLKGQCQAGQCQCPMHYTGKDCSLNIYERPNILGIINGEVCGDSFEKCSEPLLITRNVADGSTHMAALTPIQFSGLSGTVLTNATSSISAVIENKYSLSVNVSRYAPNKDVPVTGFQIKLLYKGKPTTSVNYLIADSTCLDCSATTLNCTIKKDKCFINNKCYNNEDREMTNLKVECNPGRDQQQWTPV